MNAQICRCQYIVTILCVSVNIVLGFSSQNGCGTLTIEQPAVKGRTVTFTFVPVNQSGVAIVSWLRYTPGPGPEWTSVTRATTSSTFKKDSVYHLLLSNYTDAVTTYYKVAYAFGFPFKYCEASPIHLNLTVLPECGIVYQRTPRVINGADVELSFLPSMDVNNDLDGRYWLFTPDSCSGHAECTSRNITGLYEETETERNEFVLTIPKINRTMYGVYRVECTTGRNPKLTNGTRIQISDIDVDNDNDTPHRLVWPIVGASTMVVLFIVVGLIINRITRESRDHNKPSSTRQDINHINEPGISSHTLATPPDSVYMKFTIEPGAYNYGNTYDSKYDQTQGNPEPSQDDAEDYIHLVNIEDGNILNEPDISQDDEGDDLHQVNIEDGNIVNESEINPDAVGDYLHPVHSEYENTRDLNYSEQGPYEHLNILGNGIYDQLQ